MCCMIGTIRQNNEAMAWGTKQKTVQALSLREAGILFCVGLFKPTDGTFLVCFASFLGCSFDTFRLNLRIYGQQSIELVSG